MIDDLSADTRKLLAICRSRAMQGHIQESIKQLAGNITTGISDVDKVVILMLQAEICYLNGNQNEALEIFKSCILPESNDFSHDMRLIVSDNYNVVAMANHDADSVMAFYRQFDFRRLSGVSLWDTESLVQANDAAAAGKHYDALPGYWRLVVSTYHLGCWRSYKWASARFSKECLMLGWYAEAAYHAIVALDAKLIEEIGESLLYRQDKALINATISKALSCSNLLRHAEITCSLFSTISDAIPEEQVDTVLAWLLSVCENIPDSAEHLNVFNRAWAALASLGERHLSSEQTEKIIKLASSHHLWESTSPYRQRLVRAVSSCVRLVPVSQVYHLAELVLPLATDRKNDHDFVDVLNLLCHLAEQSSDVKNFLADKLYPSTNPFLGQVSKFFGKSPDIDELRSVIEKISASILLQVQYLKKGDEPKAPSHCFCVTSENEGRKTVVYSASTAHLDTVIRHSDLLESFEIDELVSSILAMIKESENLLSNKISLLNALAGFGSKLSKQSADKVFQVLRPLALGDIQVGQIGSMSADAKNPLNPFKFNDNSPEQVNGAALYALARIEKAQPGLFASKLDSLFENALINNSPDVRRLTFAALRELPTVSSLSIIGVLFGTRDPDPEAAELAFGALGLRGTVLTLENWHQLILSLSESVKSPHKKLRRIAAITISNLTTEAPNEICPKLEELSHILKNDICFSVRRSLEKYN